MASRAFFRCRACGEPVVAGAYRCPVCAIDFPAGTPGAPVAPDSPASVDPSRPAPQREDGPRLASNVPAEVRADLIAARLDQALVLELAPPTPPVSAPLAEPVPAPTEEDLGTLSLAPAATEPSPDAGRLDTVPGVRSSGDALPEARRGPGYDAGVLHDARPSMDEPAPYGSPEAMLDVAPEREPETARDAGLPVAPARERPTAVAVADGPVRARRDKGRALAVTLAIAVLCLGGIGTAAYFLAGEPIARLAGTEAALPSGSAPLRVGSADGWVSVPAADGTVVVTADGPYRIRLDGVVYSLPNGEVVRVPMTAARSLAVRTANAPTVAEVRAE